MDIQVFIIRQNLPGGRCLIAVAEEKEVKGFLVADISDSLLTLFLNIILVELVFFFFFPCHIGSFQDISSPAREGIKPGPWQ